MGTQPSPNLPNYILSILTIRLLRGCGPDLGTACTTPGCPRFPVFRRTPKFSPSDASENLNWMNPPFWTRDLGVPPSSPVWRDRPGPRAVLRAWNKQPMTPGGPNHLHTRLCPPPRSPLPCPRAGLPRRPSAGLGPGSPGGAHLPWPGGGYGAAGKTWASSAALPRTLHPPPRCWQPGDGLARPSPYLSTPHSFHGSAAILRPLPRSQPLRVGAAGGVRGSGTARRF